MTFAAALRSILRSDPDIVLVGEIRDKETATIAIEAALTGHLVLSTLHTNDAASTPTRLVEMGVEPFLVATRARRHRRPAARPPPVREVQGAVRADDDRARDRRLGLLGRLRRRSRSSTGRSGAAACGKTGYHGRFAVHEVLLITEDIERLIVEHGHSEDIKKVAIAQGMLTLRQAGLTQVANGITTIEEILRVIV